MVEDHEVAGSAPAFGGRVGGVQGPRPREGAEDAVAVDFREKHAAYVEQLMHFGGIGHGVVGLVGLLGGGAEDGDGAVRHEDVAVGRLAQPVDHAAGEAVVEGHQRPAVGLDVDVQPRGMGQLAHPAPGGVDHEAAGDFPGLPGSRARLRS